MLLLIDKQFIFQSTYILRKLIPFLIFSVQLQTHQEDTCLQTYTCPIKDVHLYSINYGSADQCKNLCFDTPECQHFTYLIKDSLCILYSDCSQRLLGGCQVDPRGKKDPRCWSGCFRGECSNQCERTRENDITSRAT